MDAPGALRVCPIARAVTGVKPMSPKLVLWLVFASLSSTWYVLDPDAGGPFFGRADSIVSIALDVFRERIAHNP